MAAHARTFKTMDGFTISVRGDLDAFLRRIDDIEQQQVPFVTAYALTKTAQDIKAAEVDEMQRVLDRPTRFALDALFVRPATKTNLHAQVLFKDGFGSIPASHFLGPQVEGGQRVQKSHERALQRAGVLKSDEFVVPGQGVALDGNGNMPGGVITRVLSDIGANPDPLSNSTARSRRRAGKSRARYFVSRGRPGVRDGVYERKAGRGISPVMIFVRQPSYRKRLPFYEVATRVFQQNFAAHFHDGWQTYVVGQSKSQAA
jgi:hypothetical protein